MRLILLCLMTLILGIGLACKNAAAPEIKKTETAATPAPSAPQIAHNHAEDSNTPRITLADAKKEFETGTAIFLDTRDISSYKFSRIKGAIHFPLAEATTRLKELSTNKKIIAYCS